MYSVRLVIVPTEVLCTEYYSGYSVLYDLYDTSVVFRLFSQIYMIRRFCEPKKQNIWCLIAHASQSQPVINDAYGFTLSTGILTDTISLKLLPPVS